MIIRTFENTLGKVEEKILLVAIIGSLEAIKNGGITIDEAEKFLFSPHIVNKLKVKKCDEKIIELVAKGCELEDISSIIPEKLNEVIDEMKQEIVKLMQTYEEFNKSFWLGE